MVDKAVLVGITYGGTLPGPDLNEHTIHDYLIGQGFTDDNIIELVENTGNPDCDPTRENILNSLGWLVEGAQEGDNLVFSYSGHGTTSTDQNADEESGNDNCICPVDMNSAGIITDDDLHSILLPNLPSNMQLFCIFDSCFSGTVMDIPYYVDPDGTLQYAVSNSEVEPETTAAQVVVLSGCADDQTSSYTNNTGEWEGLLMAGFIDTMNNYAGCNYTDLLNHVRDYIAGQSGQQTAQLSFGYAMDPTENTFGVIAS